MKVLNVIENLEWLPKTNTMTTVLSTELPEEEFITSSFVLLFEEDKLLLAKVDSRTWDIPGGHKEKGETATETAIREVLEETNVVIENVRAIGYDELAVAGEKPEGYKYPFPKSYLAYFVADIKEKKGFTAEFETSEIQFFTLDEAKKFPWVKNHLSLCEHATKQLKEKN